MFYGKQMNVKTKILIVDDSRIFRSAIEESLSEVNDIKVIGSVRNGVKAIEFIKSTPPDLVTLDVEMPDMGGLETLEEIRKINASDGNRPPVGVIMVSSFARRGADITIRALEAGAFDFITKPEGRNAAESIEILRRQLVIKIRYFTARRISSALTKPQPSSRQKTEGCRPQNRSPERDEPAWLRSGRKPDFSLPSKIKAILIGVSTGGPKALAELLPPLCEKARIPIIIVQHMPPTFTQSLANSLDTRCSYAVTEARNEDIVQNRHAYIAPGGKHILLRRRNNEVAVVVNRQPPEKGCRPSVDKLFRSAATVYDGNVIALILTGMGNDGTKGAGILKRAGAHIIAQDEKTSVVWGMPGSAQASGNVDKVLSIGDIPEAVFRVIHKSGGV